MFYRRKILLALIEAFGGNLSRTDCQKLLFLFCLRRNRNYYDFFPHKYGCFSFLLAQDKDRLADLGFLVAQKQFQLTKRQSFLYQLYLEDQFALQNFVAEIGILRGEKLIRKAYLEYPYYASRSEIADKVLRQAEYERVCKTRNITDIPCLFTIGYEGMTIDAYINVLLANNVKVLVDVRKNPLSMKYGFSKTKFADYTRYAGILYFHIPELGVPSKLRQNLSSPNAYNTLFDFYYTEILPNQKDAIARLRNILAEQKRVAITCFEENPQFCHRHKIVEFLENIDSFDTKVVHLNQFCISKDQLVYTNSENVHLGLWDSKFEHS